MSITAAIQAAIDRLGKYNTGEYDPTANPYGLSGEGGTDANFDQLWRDVTIVSAYLGGLVNDINFVAERAAIATILQQAQALVAQITTPSVSSLAFPALDKALVAATDIVDVFTYDTRLDDRLPDGGRWNEPGRCSHTSWWNEALNTSTRGVKRDFPLVALIVAQTGKVTIFDALDLDPVTGAPRMWMVFNIAFPYKGWAAVTGIYACDGRLYRTSNTGTTGDLYITDFANDAHYYWGSGGKAVPNNPRVADRNASASAQTVTGQGIASDKCNAVHARVLPGAPLDSAGLPVPTVAVATAGGSSVIHPNGLVASVTSAYPVSHCALTGDGYLWMDSNSVSYTRYGRIPYATVAEGSWLIVRRDSIGPAPKGLGTANTCEIPGGVAQGSATVGLALVAENYANPAEGMAAYINTGYATGWLPGDARLAALCDAAMGSITGSGELVSNPGGPFTATTGWSPSGSTLAINAGRLQVTSTATAGLAPGVTIVLTLPSAGTYVVSGVAEVPPARSPLGIAGANVAFGGSGPTPFVVSFAASAAGTYTLVAYETNPGAGVGVSFYLTSISCKLAAPDRSYKSKGLVVNGTLTRSAVATSADMVAWTGFGASYLTQPYNPDLDFGTGDFCIAAWMSVASGAGGAYLDRSGTSGASILMQGSGNNLTALLSDGSTFVSLDAGVIVGLGWALVMLIRRGTTVEMWVNGAKVATASIGSSVSLTNTVASLKVGVGASALSIAMLRAAAYAPTPAQCRRIYADEAPLFQPGAKCLLGGTSNNVTKMDRDPLTDRLLVGTDAGSSILRGLVRVAYHASATVTSTTSNNHKAGGLRGGTLLLGTAAQAAIYQDAVGGKESIASGGHRPAPRPWIVTGRTTDATPTTLAPRIAIGERETGTAILLMKGRTYGASAADDMTYHKRVDWYRDAGGNVTIRGSVITVSSDDETTATPCDCTFIADTSSQTIGVQVTGKAATSIAWEGALTVTRRSEENSYAA